LKYENYWNMKIVHNSKTVQVKKIIYEKTIQNLTIVHV
jgi:hypothetical protein